MGEAEIRTIIGQFKGELIHITKGFDRLEQKIDHTSETLNDKISELSDKVTTLNTVVKGDNGLQGQMKAHAAKTEKVYLNLERQEAERKAMAKAEGMKGGTQGAAIVTGGIGALYGIIKGIGYIITHIHF